MHDFQTEVIDRSFTIPVLVDFWAPWCGPCRVLGPVIEQLAEEEKGRWELVKVNTEEEQDLAYSYHIRSIPNVKLFYRGEVVQEFMGALPKQQIREWLNRVLPPPGVIALDQLLTSSAEPDLLAVEALLNAYPDTVEIRVVLGQLLLWDDPARVMELLQPVKMGTPMYEKATWLRDVASFLLLNTEDPGLQRIQDLLKQAELEKAIVEMIELLSRNNSMGDGLLSKAAIGIFNTLGHHHPLTQSYRKKLDMVLWA